MPEIIAVHSFRGGTGKSNTTANLACLIAGKGKRVGVVDADIQSPGIHVLSNLDSKDITRIFSPITTTGQLILSGRLMITGLDRLFFGIKFYTVISLDGIVVFHTR